MIEPAPLKERSSRPSSLDLAILGLLKSQDLHGYELKRRLSEQLGFVSAVSFGSLYPALRRLETDGAVEVVIPLTGGSGLATGSLIGEIAAMRTHLSTGSKIPKSRKVYRLTPLGEKMFDELLSGEAASDDDRLFSVRLGLARHLSSGARVVMLERRKAYLGRRLISVQQRLVQPLDGFAKSLLEHDQDQLTSDLEWVDRLIAAERSTARSESPKRLSKNKKRSS